MHEGLLVRELVVRRGGKRLQGPLSFAVAPGCALEVTGPNGSGKTSLLRTLAGLVPTREGSVTRPGAALTYLGHRTALHDELDLLENLAFDARLRGQACDRSRLRHALEQVGLPHVTDRAVRRLSAGQRQRAALARLLLGEEHGLWLLDEPFSNLDDDGAALLAAMLRRHLAGGGIAVSATHQPGMLAGASILRLAAPGQC